MSQGNLLFSLSACSTPVYTTLLLSFCLLLSSAVISNWSPLSSLNDTLQCLPWVHRRNEIFANLHPVLGLYAVFSPLCSSPDSKIIRAQTVYFLRQGKRGNSTNGFAQVEHNRFPYILLLFELALRPVALILWSLIYLWILVPSSRAE